MNNHRGNSIEYQKLKDVDVVSSVVQILKEDGYIQVTGVLDVNQLDEYLDEANRLLVVDEEEARLGKRANDADYRMFGIHGTHLFNSVRKTRVFDPLVSNGLIVGLLDKLFDSMAILSQTELRRPVKGKNAAAGYHRDGRQLIDADLWMIVMWVFEDFTAQNGATTVMPGTHRVHCSTGSPTPDEITLYPKAGDVVIMNGNLLHKAGRNINNSSRWTFIPTYNPWYVKPSVDFTGYFRRSEFNCLTELGKRVYGFTSIVPNDERKRIYTCCPWEEIEEEIVFLA